MQIVTERHSFSWCPAYLPCPESLSHCSLCFFCLCISLFICKRYCASTNLQTIYFDECYWITNVFCCTSFAAAAACLMLLMCFWCILCFVLHFIAIFFGLFCRCSWNKQGLPLLVYFLNTDFRSIYLKKTKWNAQAISIMMFLTSQHESGAECACASPAFQNWSSAF